MKETAAKAAVFYCADFFLYFFLMTESSSHASRQPKNTPALSINISFTAAVRLPI